jgi:hypothetical protein
LLKWYYYVLFAVVSVVALSMTWWSMMDMGTTILDAPTWLSAGVSLVFDLGGMFLGLLSIQYAKTQDSGFWTELFAFAFIGTSAYIVIQHAILENYPMGGIVMFAAAPIVLGIMLKALLGYLTRQSRREAGRVVERLPSVGWLTWLRYGPQTWNLMSVAMQQRLVNAADRLELSPDRHGIFGDKPGVLQASLGQPQTIAETSVGVAPEVVQAPEKKQEQLSGTEPKKELTSADNVSLPVWLPNEPTMSLATLVRTCLDNGVLDIETMFRYAKDIKGQEVNKMSLAKTLSRQKVKDT